MSAESQYLMFVMRHRADVREQLRDRTLCDAHRGTIRGDFRITNPSCFRCSALLFFRSNEYALAREVMET